MQQLETCSNLQMGSSSMEVALATYKWVLQ